MTLRSLLGALLAAAAVVLVAPPFLRGRGSRAAGRRPSEAAALIEERDRALAALKELEFDHRTGKIDDDDYRELVVPLRRPRGGAAARAPRTSRAARFAASPI